MGTLVETDSSCLRDDRNTIKEELGQIRAELEKLQDEMNTLNSAWQGSAAAAYKERMAEDMESVLSVCSYLSEYLSCMKQAESAYGKCETALENIAERITVS